MAIQSDIAPAVEGITILLKKKNYHMSKSNPWWRNIISSGEKNKEIIQVGDILKNIANFCKNAKYFINFKFFFSETSFRHVSSFELLCSLQRNSKYDTKRYFLFFY